MTTIQQVLIHVQSIPCFSNSTTDDYWWAVLGKTGENSTRGGGIGFDSSGNLYVIGQTKDQAGGHLNPYTYEGYVWKISSSGALQWQQVLGESGRRKINNITRYLTILITGGQAPGYIANLQATLPESAFLLPAGIFWLSSIIILVTGTMFVMWLGEKITDRGVGNGISLLIMIGIIASFPQSLMQEFVSALGSTGGGLVIFLVEMMLLLFVILVTILLVQGTRRIPVQYAKRVVGNKQYGGVRQFIPLKVNAAGVMPIIFAQAIMFVPITLVGFSENESLQGLAAILTDFAGLWYNVLFFFMIVAFTYFYTAMTVNPNQMADDMKKNGGFIPGIRPGQPTQEYLNKVIVRVTWGGAIFLGIIAIIPFFVTELTGVQSLTLSSTSLLIMVGVALDTMRQLEAQLLMRNYEGFIK